MSSRYQLFLANTIKLVETIVIKSDETMEQLNQWVIDYYGESFVDKSRPKTWKYYQNISGQYHATDIDMVVVSWDTLETIVFNQENLAIHRATYKAYSYGTTQYMELVKKYPNQELLILGILNPVDINVAIAATNGTVLNYDKDLIEENEYSLVKKIDSWVKSFKVRWVNRQFEISDELYAATNHGIMYLQLVLAIINFRLEACKTNEAHSFHITEYLLSHGIPEVSIIHMTKKQMLFFYRNIKYIHRNAGKRDTFNWILQHIMTDRSLPISEYVMLHNDQNQLDTLYPEITFKNIKLNQVYGDTGDDYVTLAELLDKESEAAYGNPKFVSEEINNINETFEISKANSVDTKVLESSIIDYTESGQNRPEEVLLQHWLYLSISGNYIAYIGITNPQTNERIPLIAKDAYTLMLYAFGKSIGMELVYVPTVLAKRVQLNPLPSVDTLMSVVDSKYLDSSVAKQMLDYNPVIGTIKSTEAFNTLCMQIYKAQKMQRNITTLQEHEYSRGLAQNMMNRIYCDKLCRLEPEGTTYADWFNDRTLNFDNFTISEWTELYSIIVKETTGSALEQEPNLQSLQKAMIKLFESLSSYSIQFVKRINDSGVINFNRPAIRVGDIKGLVDGSIELFDSVAGINNAKDTTRQKIELDVTPTNHSSIISESFQSTFRLDAGVDVQHHPDVVSIGFRINSAPVGLNSLVITPI